MAWARDAYSRLWWWVLVGSRGGPTRSRILKALMKKPMNKHQIAKELGLNYKTVEHHLEILQDNMLVETPNPDKYGSLYYLHREAVNRLEEVKSLIREALGDE